MSRQSEKHMGTLASMLGIDAGSLLDYLSGCLLEHLVYSLAQDKEWLAQIRKNPEALAIFRERVQSRTQFVWYTENLSLLFDRVKQAAEKHYRKPITYEELLRLLINAPLECAFCHKAPPAVKLHIDHVFPASRGGDSSFENLQFLCQDCNLRKSDKLPITQLWVRLESLRPY